MLRFSGPGLLGKFARFARATGGGVAIWTAICVPPLAILAVGSVELASVASDRSKMQDAADAAALTAARELGFSGPGGVIERAQSNALSALADVAQHSELTATATLDSDSRTVSVVITGHRMSFFGNLLPPGGFNTRAAANATALGAQPLCVIALSTTAGDTLHMKGSSRLQSPGCLVQSNNDVKADGQASITVGEVQVAGSASGTIAPAPLVGAPVLADPYASTAITFPAICNVGDILNLDQGLTGTLQPGMHCGTIDVKNGATLTLAPGVHYFRNADIKMHQNASLIGNGVTLIFDERSSIDIKDTSVVDLQGSRSGPWAGFIIVGPRTRGEDFKFDSDNINRLEGVIYLPNNRLEISGAAQIAEGSNWTVTLADTIEVNGSTTLVINSNYAGSNVPVPAGVGPTPGTRLRR